MNNKTHDPSSEEPLPGTPSEEGKALDPSNLPSDEPPADEPDSRAIPIGRPVSPEEYRRLKAEAEKTNKPPASSAQEDV